GSLWEQAARHGRQSATGGETRGVPVLLEGLFVSIIVAVSPDLEQRCSLKKRELAHAAHSSHATSSAVPPHSRSRSARRLATHGRHRHLSPVSSTCRICKNLR